MVHEKNPVKWGLPLYTPRITSWVEQGNRARKDTYKALLVIRNKPAGKSYVIIIGHQICISDINQHVVLQVPLHGDSLNTPWNYSIPKE